MKRPPIGQRICQACNERIIPSYDIACHWCWRSMDESDRDLARRAYRSIRYIVPTTLTATPTPERRRIFRSLVVTGYGKQHLFSGLVRLELLVSSGRKVRADTNVSEVVDALTGRAWLYPDQVAEVAFHAERVRETEFTDLLVRGLPER